MRILVCADEAPLPPLNGDRLQLRSLLGELRRRHQLRVVAPLASDQTAPPPDPELRLLPGLPVGGFARVRRAAGGILSNLPSRTRAMTALMREPIRQALARFEPDVVHVSSTHAARLWPDFERWPTVLAAIDATHLNLAAEAELLGGARGWLRSSEARRRASFEARFYARFGRVVVVSDEDAAALAALNPAMRLEVIPNGVDLDAFAKDPSIGREPGLIMFTGVMSYAPNVTAAEFAARRVLPQVRALRADARLAIVGRSPDARVRALGGLPGVEVWGEVPEMRPALSRGAVYLCPMLTGTGIKNKLLEALANGLPSVVTPLALQGIRARHEEGVLVGDREESLAAHLVRLLEDAELARRIGRDGRELVRRHYTWPAVAEEYERLFAQVIEERDDRGRA